MRPLLALGLVVTAWVIAGCGSSSAPSVLKPTGNNNSSGSQSLFEGNCDLLASPFGGGDGSISNPYVICTAAQLANVGNSAYLEKHFLLTKDLDVAGSGIAVGGIDSFSGVFDGGGHRIYNLSQAGLFRSIVKSGLTTPTIRNLTVAGDVYGGGFRSGMLVGELGPGALVENCHAQGTLTGGGSQVGGLVGFNEGTITRSSANVAITATDYAGGLVGVNKGAISRSFALGSVSATHATLAVTGGFVGDNFSSGTITDSYARGTAQGKARVGGFFGQCSGGIDRVYSTGSVLGTGGSNIGGLGGLLTGTVANSYWDTDTSGQGTSAGGTGRSTTDMKSLSTYASWDFTTLWDLPSGGYPTLR